MMSLYGVGALLLRAVPGSRARGKRREYRDLARLRAADIAFVSFPKSGRTFVRAMLARLYQQQFEIDERELLEFATLRRAPREVPRILFTHDNDAMRRPTEIRIKERVYRRRRLVLLARHPGDVIVSRYHHLRHRSRDSVRRQLAERPIDDFVWTDHGGIPSIVAYLNSWASFAKRRGDVLIVRYEDFVGAPTATLQRLASFIGLGSISRQISDAVESARFDHLQAKEREGYFTTDRLRARSADQQESSKVRSGGFGGFRKVLTAENSARIDAYIEAHLDPLFGYASDLIRNSDEDKPAAQRSEVGSGDRCRQAHPIATVQPENA